MSVSRSWVVNCLVLNRDPTGTEIVWEVYVEPGTPLQRWRVWGLRQPQDFLTVRVRISVSPTTPSRIGRRLSSVLSPEATMTRPAIHCLPERVGTWTSEITFVRNQVKIWLASWLREFPGQGSTSRCWLRSMTLFTTLYLRSQSPVVFSITVHRLDTSTLVGPKRRNLTTKEIPNVPTRRPYIRGQNFRIDRLTTGCRGPDQ